jgi:hypothetical protein
MAVMRRHMGGFLAPAYENIFHFFDILRIDSTVHHLHASTRFGECDLCQLQSY